MEFLLVGGINFHVEGGGHKTRTDAQPLGRMVHIVGHFRRPQMPALFMNGHIDLAELQLGDGAQGLL